MERQVRSVAMSSGSLSSRKNAMLAELRSLKNPSEAVNKIIRKIDSCSPARRCNEFLCQTCSDPKKRQGNRHVSSVERIKYGCANALGTARGKLSSNYQVRSAQKLVEPFDGLPLCFLHPITINSAYTYLDADLGNVAVDIKSRLRRCYNQLTNGAIIRGSFDLKILYADGQSYEIPIDDIKSNWEYPRRDHERVAMVHPHFIVYDPILTRDEVRAVFADEYHGNNRICIREPHTDKVLANGEVSHGIQGYAEYASLGKVELQFGKDNADVLEEFIKINDTWNGRSKLIRFGNRTPHTEALLDKTILTEYLNELDHKLAVRSWEKADASSKFMHIWKHYSSHIMEAVKALNEHSSVNDNNELLRNFVGFLSNQTFDQLADIDKVISNGCIWYSMLEYCLRGTSDTLAKPSYIIYCSNSSRGSASQHTTFAGFVNSNNPHICEKHAQLIPP